MAVRFVTVDRDTPLLMVPDLRDWVAEDDLVHFVIECINQVSMDAFSVNERGSGDRQYPPRMMLALLVYCYSQGIFSSRRIERATYQQVSVRYLTADTHPDHDTISTFRRRHFDAVHQAFLKVLQLARELHILRLGTVSIDGTKMAANASLKRNLRLDRARELDAQLSLEITGLLERAEAADQAGEGADESLPAALRKRQALHQQVVAARERMEATAAARISAEQAEYQRKVDARNQRPGPQKGKHPKPPDDEPPPNMRTNLTDPDSQLMCTTQQHPPIQAYNAQLAVDADGSGLILGAQVSLKATDSGELLPTLNAIPRELGRPGIVLADSGYYTHANHDTLLVEGIHPLIAPGTKAPRHPHDLRATPPPSTKPPRTSPLTESMRERLASPLGKRLYRLRRQTVEPVFGILRNCLGFNHFHLRGLEGVNGEWQLLSLAYNLKRLHRLLPTRT